MTVDSTDIRTMDTVSHDMDGELDPRDLLINMKTPSIDLAINSVTDEVSMEVDVAMDNIDPPLPQRSRRTRMIPK